MSGSEGIIKNAVRKMCEQYDEIQPEQLKLEIPRLRGHIKTTNREANTMIWSPFDLLSFIAETVPNVVLCLKIVFDNMCVCGIL